MNFTTINNHVIHYKYLKSTENTTFVFGNSLGTDFRIWDEVIAILKPHGSILCFDKRGHGLSEAPKGEVAIKDYVSDIVGLMDFLGIKKCVYVGLSIGGIIGQKMATTHPERISYLILSNTAPKIGNNDAWNGRINAVQTNGLASITDAVMQRWFSEKFHTERATELTGYKMMLQNTSPTGYNRACEAIRDEDLTENIKKIKLPTLCIGGSVDLSTPPALVQAMSASIKKSKCEIIEGVGHLPCVENPTKTAELILDFIAPSLNLFEQGMKTRRAVLGDEHVNRAEANKTDFDKDFQTYITNSAWGAIWSRPGLTKRERSMITIAVLASLGHEEELAMHLRATKNTGATEADIKETLLHIAIYAGVPVTNGAMKIAKKVFS
jgi:3-oxoadipate enol-lactonase / 4-carboxymuconolactone decarboxylase